MFSFDGRSTRSQFLGVIVTDIIFGAIVYGAYTWIGRSLGGLRAVPTEIAAVVLFVFCALVVPLVVATVATSVKRFHDRGKNGWWALSVLVVIGLVEGLLAKGTEGKNVYGAGTVSKAAPVASPVKTQAPQAAKPTTPQPPTQTETSLMKGQPIPPIQTMPQSAVAPTPVKPSTPQAQVPPKPVTPQTPVAAPVAQTTAPQATSAPVKAQTSAPASPQIPPARSMSEMLAELQKLAAKENAMATKAPVKPTTSPVVASAPVATPAPVQAKAPQAPVAVAPQAPVAPAPAKPASPQPQVPPKATPSTQATL